MINKLKNFVTENGRMKDLLCQGVFFFILKIIIEKIDGKNQDTIVRFTFITHEIVVNVITVKDRYHAVCNMINFVIDGNCIISAIYDEHFYSLVKMRRIDVIIVAVDIYTFFFILKFFIKGCVKEFHKFIIS